MSDDLMIFKDMGMADRNVWVMKITTFLSSLILSDIPISGLNVNVYLSLVYSY